MSNEILRVSNIEKYYGKNGNITKAINNISFTVNKGEFVGIMGASGSGKTTLLNCISTIDKASSGHIYINNNDIKNIIIVKYKHDMISSDEQFLRIITKSYWPWWYKIFFQ